MNLNITTISEELLARIDNEASKEKRKRASMARILVEEALDARKV